MHTHPAQPPARIHVDPRVRVGRRREDIAAGSHLLESNRMCLDKFMRARARTRVRVRGQLRSSCVVFHVWCFMCGALRVVLCERARCVLRAFCFVCVVLRVSVCMCGLVLRMRTGFSADTYVRTFHRAP